VTATHEGIVDGGVCSAGARRVDAKYQPVATYRARKDVLGRPLPQRAVAVWARFPTSSRPSSRGTPLVLVWSAEMEAEAPPRTGTTNAGTRPRHVERSMRT
jgi:hypothetical protein